MIVRSEAEGIAKVTIEGRLEVMRTCALQSVQLPLVVQHQQECLLWFCSDRMSFTCITELVGVKPCQACPSEEKLWECHCHFA